LIVANGVLALVIGAAKPVAAAVVKSFADHKLPERSKRNVIGLTRPVGVRYVTLELALRGSMALAISPGEVKLLT